MTIIIIIIIIIISVAAYKFRPFYLTEKQAARLFESGISGRILRHRYTK
jgi:hypothetical protein